LTSPSPIEAQLARAASEIAAPLCAAAASPQALCTYVQSLGWQVNAIHGLEDALAPLARSVTALQALAALLQQRPIDSLATLSSLVPLGVELEEVAKVLARVRFPTATPAEAASLAAELALDVTASLTSTWLRWRWPLPRLVLVALGVLERRALPALTLGGAVVREAAERERPDFEQLGRWLTDPSSALRALGQRHASPGTTGALLAVEAWNIIGPTLPDALHAAHLASIWLPAEPARGVPGSLWIFAAPDQLGDIGASSVAIAQPGDGGTANAWVVLGLEAASQGVEFHVIPGGRWLLDRNSERWQAGVQASATGAITFAGSSVRTTGTATATATLSTRTTPTLQFGPVGGPGLSIGSLALGVQSTFANGQPWVLELSLDVTGIAVQIGAGGGDGFLAKVLPSLSLPPLDLGLRWSPREGLRFAVGARASRVVLARGLVLGPVEMRELALTATAGSDGVALALDSILRLALGPVDCTISGLGLLLGLGAAPGAAGFASLRAGVQPPSGVGIKINAGPVSGGGDLFFNVAEEQYGGIVQLSIKKKIALNAVALITTRLPGLPPGQKGFSLLLIITAEFPPLPLGFGFTLNGIGGLIGINRTMMLEPLRNSVRDRSIEGILFPQNPLANATSLVASLQRIFPPAEGRYVFGPMVKVGWGPTQLITVEAALILELPSPLRLVLLGRMRAVLPDKIAPVVDLRLDIVGVLDFDRGEASVDASFVDSRLAGFTLTGDMALRLGWGATKAFALAAGGFNPRYTPPPSFPVLRRLTLSLANSDNPRFRLESYLALTSNTIQFGARAELSAKVQTAIGEFGAAAMIFFDALIELDPFGFIVDLGAVIEVTLAGRPLIQAQLMATLSGTKPWHAVGFVEVVFLGRHRIPFEARVGDQEPTTLPTIDVLDKLIEEVQRPESWSTVPPAEAADVVVLKDSSASGAVLLHPLGTVALRQRLLPFGKRIARFGSAVPEGGAVMFALTGIEVGGRMDAVTPLLDDFAPGQYEVLSEDEKLSRPAFERMQAGVEAAASLEIRLPNARPGTTMRGTQASIDYEEVVIDRVARPSRRPRRRKKPVMPIGLVAAMADDGVVSDLVFTGPVDRAIAVPGERWREADADHLGALPGARAGSAAEAYDRRALSRRPADQTTVIALHEAA
jgi:hypothetical protein